MCVARRPKQRLEMLPLLEPLAVDGLANLLRACRAHTALGLMKLDALRFEGQRAKVENASHAVVEISDHILMMNAQDAPGEHAIPMAHQLEIGPIVTRDVLDAVGELLPTGKELLQVAEAA